MSDEENPGHEDEDENESSALGPKKEKRNARKEFIPEPELALKGMTMSDISRRYMIWMAKYHGHDVTDVLKGCAYAIAALRTFSKMHGVKWGDVEDAARKAYEEGVWRKRAEADPKPKETEST
jgi:hypothetical protein